MMTAATVLLVLAGAYIAAYAIAGLIVALADRLGLVYPKRGPRP